MFFVTEAREMVAVPGDELVPVTITECTVPTGAYIRAHHEEEEFYGASNFCFVLL